ncbi:OBAP family protein [Spirosoma utsteinense]|uniref:DUF1264 domain-containing protein n=1 Tax=Spirosoma utsteinense TaxID=2585773 RepID=A0ABR6W882_9BACT|nr:OBAP family protein [Spirosoma utsteinense]MBC3784132.1 hypothetical protein [Spirosoma utsteinense]MBC3792779.1 hypothetical protein [Spirosoma utsteinense]
MKRIGNWAVLVVIALGCGGKNTSSNVQSPGSEKTTKTTVLEAGATALQDKTPVDRLEIYLNGFHFYNGQINGQMEAHHYCTKLNEDLTQCVIYDGNGNDAKIMGVEYIVSEKLFKTLPPDEKKLWHSHAYEVKSGELIAPGLPIAAEHELMETIVSTYGKTWHTWHTDQDLTLPLGNPALMMGFTKDGQLKPDKLADRDKRFNVSTAEKRKNRSDIPVPPAQPGANSWQSGEIIQLPALTGHKHEHVKQNSF